MQLNWKYSKDTVIWAISIALSISALVLAGGYLRNLYEKYYAPNVPRRLSNPFVLIPTNTSFPQFVDILVRDSILLDRNTFEIAALAERVQQGEKFVRAGRFKVEPRMSNHALLQLFTEGKQSPVRVVINNKNTKEELAGYLARFIEADSTRLLQAMNDTSLLNKLNLSPQNFLTLIIPNTYEFFWNTTPKQFIERMSRESHKFWTPQRLRQCNMLALTPSQVVILASIVEKETLQNEEKSRIAGVYINRLKKFVTLDANPTLHFILPDTVKELTSEHKHLRSPYNTYYYKGLPPGPICMPSITTLDFTLQAERHPYLFFCARPDTTGFHIFETNFKDHKKNVVNYRRFKQAQERLTLERS